MSAPGTLCRTAAGPHSGAGTAAAANVDVERRSPPLSRRLADTRGLSPSRNRVCVPLVTMPSRFAVLRSVTMSRDSGSGHFEPNQLARRPGALLLLERRPADEIIFLPADDPA